MKGFRLYLIIAGIIVVLYAVAEFNRPKQIDWTETFSDKDKIPFGTYVLHNRINDIFPGARVTRYQKPIFNVTTTDSIKNTSYIIVCGNIEISKTDYGALANFVKNGNDVFIAAEYFGKTVEKNLGVQLRPELNVKNNISLRFLSPALNPQKTFNIDKGATNTYFSKFDTTQAVVLGENSKHNANFIKFKLGKGSLYLNANPRLFSNYSLLKKDGAEYTATALSFVKNAKHLAWDEYYTQGSDDEDSIMRVFFDSAALQWAYYITLFSLLVFVLFEVKRRQRIIPVIAPLSNSTLDFVNVVGQVYYEKRNNTNIAHKKILYFFEHLRDQYQIKTGKLDGEFIEKLKTKLGVDAALANEFVAYIKYIDVQDRITDNELINLNRLIEKLNSQFA